MLKKQNSFPFLEIFERIRFSFRQELNESIFRVLKTKFLVYILIFFENATFNYQTMLRNEID